MWRRRRTRYLPRCCSRALVEFGAHLFWQRGEPGSGCARGRLLVREFAGRRFSRHHARCYVAPGKALRLRGALGPFQGLGVEGSMTWSLKASANGTDISVSYAVGGYAKDGFDGASKAADRVLGEQIERLRKFIDGSMLHQAARLRGALTATPAISKRAPRTNFATPINARDG